MAFQKKKKTRIQISQRVTNVDSQTCSQHSTETEIKKGWPDFKQEAKKLVSHPESKVTATRGGGVT